MNDRTRGIAVYPMTDPDVCGPYAENVFALIIRNDGQVKMVHTEGVAYGVSADRPWRWNDYDANCPTFSAHELINRAFYVKPVDLADWVRTFGARLESNFGQIVRWNNDAEAVA